MSQSSRRRLACPVTLVSIRSSLQAFSYKLFLSFFFSCSITFSWKGLSHCNIYQPSCEYLCLLTAFIPLLSLSIGTIYKYPKVNWSCCLLSQFSAVHLHTQFSSHHSLRPSPHSSICSHILSLSLFSLAVWSSLLFFAELCCLSQSVGSATLVLPNNQTLCHWIPSCTQNYHKTFHS